jgi:hypothetical protein
MRWWKTPNNAQDGLGQTELRPGVVKQQMAEKNRTSGNTQQL